MSTDYLIPNAAGDVTTIDTQTPGTGEHWDKVDDPVGSPDNSATYIDARNIADYEYDLYNLTNTAASGTISYIIVHYQVLATYASGSGWFKPLIKTGGTEFYGTELEITIPVAWRSGSHQWTINPDTGVAWTVSDLNALQVGAACKRPIAGEQTRCTQIYVEVDYVATDPPAATASPATNVEETAARLNGNVTDTGGEDPTVTVYWGTSDGGEIPGNWANSATPTSPAQPQGVAAFYKDVTGLPAGTTIYFKAKATNSAGTGWSATQDFLTKQAPGKTAHMADKMMSAGAL